MAHETLAEGTVAMAISPASSFFFPSLQPTLSVTGAVSTPDASTTAALATAAGSAVQASGNGAIATPQSPLTSGLVDPATADQSSLLSQTGALGAANLSGMALLQGLLANGVDAGLLSYPSAANALPTLLQQLQSSFVPPYNAFGMIDPVQPLGTLVNVTT